MLVVTVWALALKAIMSYTVLGLVSQSDGKAVLSLLFSAELPKLLALVAAVFVADTFVRIGYWGSLLSGMNGSDGGLRACYGTAGRMLPGGLAGQLLAAAIAYGPAVVFGAGLVLAKKYGYGGLLIFSIGAFAAALVFMFWAGVRLAFWVPVLLSRGTGGLAAVKGSFDLTTADFWRIFTITVLPYAVAGALHNLGTIHSLRLGGELLGSYVLPLVLPAAVLLLFAEISGRGPASAPAAVPAEVSPQSRL
jgi:hypothetical protein